MLQVGRTDRQQISHSDFDSVWWVWAWTVKFLGSSWCKRHVPSKPPTANYQPRPLRKFHAKCIYLNLSRNTYWISNCVSIQSIHKNCAFIVIVTVYKSGIKRSSFSHNHGFIYWENNEVLIQVTSGNDSIGDTSVLPGCDKTVRREFPKLQKKYWISKKRWFSIATVDAGPQTHGFLQNTWPTTKITVPSRCFILVNAIPTCIVFFGNALHVICFLTIAQK